MDDQDFPVELVLTRGLPACGKSTEARRIVAREQAKGRRIVRINRDELRRMMLPQGYSKPEYQWERVITLARDCFIQELLCDGVSVIADDTNLVMKYARNLADLALRLGVGFRTIDFFDVPLDVCLERDRLRGEMGDPGFVGAPVIREYHSRFFASSKPGPVLPRETAWQASVEPYVPSVVFPSVVLCDVDGTLALLNGRDPYDESCVLNDSPNTAVVGVLQALTGFGQWERFGRHDHVLDVVFMSGRTDGCREDTLAWLHTHVFNGSPYVKLEDIKLYMRASGDQRPDHVVKLELFNKHVRHHCVVEVVLDDRDQVVKLWRSLGLTCLQVAEGNF